MTILQNGPVPSRGKKLIASAAVIAIVIIIIVILKVAKPEPPAPTLQENLTLVNADRLTLNTTRPSFTTIGHIRATAVTELKSVVTGQVAATHVESGEKVIKNQLLLSINPIEQQRLLYQAEAQLTQATSALQQAQTQHAANIKLLKKDKQLSLLADRSLKRYKDLLKRKLANEAQVDQATEVAQRQSQSTLQRQIAVDNWPAQMAQLNGQLKLAQAQFEQAQEDLAKTQITAPFDGRVHTLTVADNSRVSKGTLLISLVNNDNLLLEASIPEKIVTYLNQKTSEQLSEQPSEQRQNTQLPASTKLSASAKLWGETLHFELKTLSQQSTATGGTVALFKPTNPDKNLPMNRTMEAQIHIPLLENAYAIPVVALHNYQYIYLLGDDNRLKRKDVYVLGETIKDSKRHYLISASDIPVNSAYVTSQMVRDVNGMKVQPTE